LRLVQRKRERYYNELASKSIWLTTPFCVSRPISAQRGGGNGTLGRLNGIFASTICIGSTFQSVSTTMWTLLYIAACRRKLCDTWSRVAHQFRKSPAVDYYAQPVDNTLGLLCYRVTGWACSGAFGLFRSPVLIRGTLYRIVSVIQYWVLTVFEETNT